MKMDEQISPYESAVQITQRRPVHIPRSFTGTFTEEGGEWTYRFKGTFFWGKRANFIPECPIFGDQFIDQGGDLFRCMRPSGRNLRRSQAGHRWVVVVFEGEDRCDRG